MFLVQENGWAFLCIWNDSTYLYRSTYGGFIDWIMCLLLGYSINQNLYRIPLSLTGYDLSHILRLKLIILDNRIQTVR
jgi:hypothetical protein